ncbi:glycosyltransferase family 4 protein [Corynebacterium sp. HS2168-gen11]|uniref:glycosyltransferase family 4 protein n=1 Tax=Corynebacterium sp. HS2168-gen11 TaxID=2974027 RepID=UPI00216AC24E|nr:glycosyltransferase family 4 protein [Corynebacterium sp. HS2168-gen11]MCS4535988.1 glycosyltransferase family 4 protein [Corynebacterium sp. HS2168-gen11]
MNILLLCWRDLDHPQGGGSERYLERVAEHLAASGHTVTYFTARFPHASRRTHRNGFRILRSGGKYGVYIHAAVFMLLGRLGIGPLAKTDVVVDTQNGIPFFAKCFSGRPTVLLTHHCHKEQWSVATALVAKLGWWLESKVSPWVHRHSLVVTVSRPSQQELIDLGFLPENISIVRNGIDPVPEHYSKLMPDPRTHIVTLARLVPHKQIEDAIWAVHDQPDLVLDVIGDGWWAEKLKIYAANLQAKNVVFHGHVAEEVKHALLDRAALHLMPSRKEGWGLAVIEAAQHHVPTIGYTSSGGLQDSIQHNRTGLLVAGRTSLKQALLRLLHNPNELTRLGQTAYIQSKRYRWEDTGQQIAQLLTVALRRHNATPTGTRHHNPSSPTPS